MTKVVARRRQGYAHDVRIEGGHSLVFDEPREAGGTDEGPSPTRMLGAALAACTAITMQMYAERKGWDIGDTGVDVDIEYERPAFPRSFTVTLRFPEGLSAEQVERLRVIAGKCPVHRALSEETEVVIA